MNDPVIFGVIELAAITAIRAVTKEPINTRQLVGGGIFFAVIALIRQIEILKGISNALAWLVVLALTLNDGVEMLRKFSRSV